MNGRVEVAKTLVEHELRMVFSGAGIARAQRRRADAADQELFARMRKAHAAGATYRQIAKAADCSHEWVGRCVRATDGAKP